MLTTDWDKSKFSLSTVSNGGEMEARRQMREVVRGSHEETEAWRVQKLLG